MRQVFFPVPKNEERKKQKQKQRFAFPSFFETKTRAYAPAPPIECTTLDFKKKTTNF